ncbi:circadian clock KaiB family protein [Myxosarcina sp. GI1]|uniref:circadian clock KaiB family protein n=1 Tax=Myxosarcina sp. GI1 TaxID=1541065 RepID=UPI00056245F8|nr:circadian clock KaiB family protein [Myxosarcina sp. GI1]
MPKSTEPPSLPDTFKGIALFTPGGDLIYGIDAERRSRWHIHLCSGLQEIWGLSETPHFLVPGYTATVDCWRDRHSQQLQVVAETYPAVKRYIPLLNTVFGLEEPVKWKIISWQEEYCSRAILETYRQQFPQLWEERDLIVRLDPSGDRSTVTENLQESDTLAGSKSLTTSQTTQGEYVLRLFISSSDRHTEKTLAHIHQLLERGLTTPYTLKVIDIDKHPERGRKERVIITPTLIRVFPQPVKRIVGELNNIQQVLQIISS